MSGKSWSDLLKGILIFVALLPGACVVLGFLSLRAFTIPAASMIPNLQVGDYMLADRFRTPLHGEVMRGDVFTLESGGRVYVKRIVGLPGDTVKMIEGRLIINGKPVGLVDAKESIKVLNGTASVQIETLPAGKSYRILDMVEGGGDNTQQWLVPKSHYFALGDNRDNSADSRFYLGLVPEENNLGKVRFVLFNTKGK